MLENNQIINEPNEHWGGAWTKQKLDAFIDYLQAYLKIFKTHPQWKTIYFDGFAGSGEILKKKKHDKLTLDFEIDKNCIEDIDIYKGSVNRVLEPAARYFDYYYFIDTNENNIKCIEVLKRQVHLKDIKVEARISDCNIEIPKLADALNSKKYAALIFLDPFGMQVKWEAIQTLKNTRSDIWILIPSGVAINRLLPKSGEIKCVEKLEEFFGLPIAEIKNYFYPEQEISTLFGSKIEQNKLTDPIEGIISLYTQQLRKVWKLVSQPLILKNSKKCSIFHLIFASNQETGIKIANSIISKKTK